MPFRNYDIIILEYNQTLNQTPAESTNEVYISQDARIRINASTNAT